MQYKTNTKKKYLIIFCLLIILSPIFSDSISLDTEILSVSNGPYQFGFGLAPTGTYFRYYNSFNMHPSLLYDADFNLYLDFYTPHRSYGGYDYISGTPDWYNEYNEIKDDANYNLSGEYFNPEADLNITISQGFGTNPVAGEGYLVKLGFEFESRYSMALESLDTHINSTSPVFINPQTGEYNNPFGPGTPIPAYPWLQDTRNSLTNSLRLYCNIDLSVRRGFRIDDGLYFSSSIEYGPYWLGNNLTMQFPTSDYYQISGTLTQYLSLYSKKQDNGRNWLSIQLRHYDSLQHTGGKVVPRHKIPGDRLENYFSDAFVFDIYGPQFIAGDCYSDITLGLYNYCYFGHIVNEASKSTYAVEWKSDMEMRFHLRLFGFMHFKYTAGYTFYSGIHTSHPGFYQNAKVSFYISL